MQILLRSVVLGVGATLTMDLWAALLRRFGIPSLNFAMLGRWIGHLPRGKLAHASIARAPPIEHERLIGWVAHYAIGIVFAGLLLTTYGLSWASAPTLPPALVIGLFTVVAPLFILQPALGLGIASRKTPSPTLNAIKSVATHTVYGLGLYATARLTAHFGSP
jgi:hypothetical protein